MAANKEPGTSEIGDLSSLTKTIHYKSTVQYLPDSNGVDLKVFDNSELSDQFYLDTKHVVTKRKTFNVKCLYDTFADYCELQPYQVKEKMLDEIRTNWRWYKKASLVCLGMRQLEFDAWLKRLEKPRTWPNELALYALCVTFRRNAMVFNAGRIWTSMEVKPNMTQGICQEMCESVFLYLGNNLYGILRRRPFTLERPVLTLLDDIQKMRPLFVDTNLYTMYFEVRKDSSYESLIQEEEIEIPPEQKPELLPDVVTRSVLDPDFVPDYLPIKEEPNWDQSVVGHIIDQPGLIAKEIKQELLDTAAQSIASKHSSSCQINQFVQGKGVTGIRIEDVRSLLDADENASSTMVSQDIAQRQALPEELDKLNKSQPQSTRWSRIQHKRIPIEDETSAIQTNQESLNVVTNITTAAAAPLSTVTHPSVSQSHLTQPLSVVTASPIMPTLTMEVNAASLCIATHSSVIQGQTTQPLSVVTTHPVETQTDSSKSLSETTAPATTDTSTVATTIPLCVVTDQTITQHRSEQPLSVVTASATAETPSSSEIDKTLSMVTPSETGAKAPVDCPASYRYYDVLTPEEDDIVSISHQEIMERQCNVTLDQLDPADIEDIQQKLRPRTVDTTPSTADQCSPLKKKRESHRPLRHPSKLRIAAQLKIRKRNEQIKAGQILPKPVKAVKPESVLKSAQGETGVEPNKDEDISSDDTIIYDQPPEPEPAKITKPKKPAAKFVIRTIGLKAHKDAAMIQHAKKTRKRAFKCYLCVKRFPSTKGLNDHFRKTHEGLDCDVCGRDFNSPLSLKKHSYVHGLRPHRCQFCGKDYPFKSERDIHENTHTKAVRFTCKREGCRSSFSRDSDLKLHDELHDAKPIQCSVCTYSNPDIRNVRQHERVHTDEKPYKCSKCDMTFKFSMQRKRHETKPHD